MSYCLIASHVLHLVQCLASCDTCPCLPSCAYVCTQRGGGRVKREREREKKAGDGDLRGCIPLLGSSLDTLAKLHDTPIQVPPTFKLLLEFEIKVGLDLVEVLCVAECLERVSLSDALSVSLSDG